jgi:hypothetical protein
MIFTTEHPGDWQYYVKRPDNIGLNIMDIKRKYLVEQHQHEQQILSLLGTTNGWGASYGGFSPNITINDVLAAQSAWGNAVIAIGNAYGSSGAINSSNAGYIAATTLASSVLSSAYDYDNGTVFFRPTIATSPDNFRNTKARALSYFVGYTAGGTPGGVATDTTGFATSNRWQSVVFNNFPGGTAGPDIGINIVSSNLAFTMGYVSFSGALAGSFIGQTVTVDKTFGYYKDPTTGIVRIILHISALTNSAN